jgi:N-acetylglutamate synthase-like GNAT family acetyltransferase
MELQRLQEKAPQGKSFVVSTVNIPDFFSRVRVYESWKVFNAYHNDRIVGSAACAIRDAVVGGRIHPVGYEFQYFTSPEYRRKSIAQALRKRIEHYLSDQGTVLSYACIMEGNLPSMRLFERQGFHLHRRLVMPAIAVRKEVRVHSDENIRSVTSRDLEAVAELLNQTWSGHDLFEPASAERLAHTIERTENLSYNNMFVLENRGRITACAALWDWSKIMRINVLRFTLKMQILLRVLFLTRVLPRFPRPGDILRQMMLTMVGYKSPADLAPLVEHVNNLAWKDDVEQVFCICERKDELLQSLKGFTRIDTGVNLYVKLLHSDISLTDAPVAMTGFDM